MRRNLRPEDVGELLTPPRIAVLATKRRDGSVLLSPVWQEWTDGGFTIVTFVTDVKMRHLRDDPRVTIVVAEEKPPYRGIEVHCEAREIQGDASLALRRLATRYLGPDRVDDYMAKIGDAALTLLRLEPGRLRAWDYADEAW